MVDQLSSAKLARAGFVAVLREVAGLNVSVWLSLLPGLCSWRMGILRFCFVKHILSARNWLDFSVHNYDTFTLNAFVCCSEGK